MSNKKVLVWETLATVSGGQKMTLTVLDMLSDQYEFCCLIPSEGMLSEELKKRNIPYVLMGDQTLPTGVKGKQVIFRYGWMSVKNVCKSLNQIRKYKPDMLYCPGPAALPWSAVCGSLTGKPVIWHLHHIFLDGATKKLLNICGKWKSVRKIIAISEAVGNQITAEQANTKIKVLYNPVDARKYASGDSRKILVEVQKHLEEPLQNYYPIILQIGAITKNKNQAALLDVLAELNELGKNPLGIIIGQTISCADQEYKNALYQTAEKMDIYANLLFVGQRSDVEDFFPLADCVFIPSIEGLSLVALEAMAAKCRIVTSRAGGIGELLSAANCGTFYEPGTDSKAMAEAVLESTKDKGLQSGYEYCQKLSNENYKAQLITVFDKEQGREGKYEGHAN